MRGVLVSIVVAAALLVLAGLAQAAAPNYIFVSGPGLERPILLTNWGENLELLSALVRAPRARGLAAESLSRRPRLGLDEFWGWGSLPRPTRPNQANQHGWFYPAHAGRRPIVEMMVNGSDVPRLAPARVLVILGRHGVPIRLP